MAEIAEARSGIEQAKGMLMLIYRINAESAFELLKWRSQETNTKLRVLAEQIAKDFLDLPYDEVLPARARVRQVAADLASACRVLRFIRCADREICRTSDCGFLAANSGAGRWLSFTIRTTRDTTIQTCARLCA